MAELPGAADGRMPAGVLVGTGVAVAPAAEWLARLVDGRLPNADPPPPPLQAVNVQPKSSNAAPRAIDFWSLDPAFIHVAPSRILVISRQSARCRVCNDLVRMVASRVTFVVVRQVT